MSRRRYRAHGLIFDSALELADLTPAEEALAVDMSIDLGDLGREPGGLRKAGAARYSTSGGRLWFEIPGIGRFEIDPVGKIVIDPHDGRMEAALPILTGSVFAAVGAMRGRVPLHAGCVVRSGSAFAFAAESGVGKSTLAAALGERGYAIYSDDLILVDPAGALPRVAPGLRRIKLWKDAAERHGLDVSGLAPVSRHVEKYFVPIPPLESGFVPLRAFYWLEEGDGGSEPEIMRIEGVDALQLFLSQIYRRELLDVPGVSAGYLPRAAAIARRVPSFRFRRPRTIERLANVVDRFADHFAEIDAARASNPAHQ